MMETYTQEAISLGYILTLLRVQFERCLADYVIWLRVQLDKYKLSMTLINQPTAWIKEVSCYRLHVQHQ